MKHVAIYVRRSISDTDKGNNSISIQGQKEDCISYVQKHYPNMEYKIYCDDGKSGKDVQHRPAFLQMMEDAKLGEIEVIVVKKYDRFSRNTRDYMNVTDELQKYDVGVISLSEPFDTATKEGRMMRGIVLQFAEFERETIAYRVKDAYNTKARETGFYQGGQTYFGYKSERRCVNGKMGSVLVPSEVADTVKLMYEMYSHPTVSLQDIMTYIDNHHITKSFTDHNNRLITRPLSKTHISNILCNPLYVKADVSVYQYLKAKGCEMCDDVLLYDGTHGLFQHKSNNKKYIKLGYHEGLVDASVWLAVQERKDSFSKHKNKAKPCNSWLSGLMKCAHCGYALCINQKDNGRRKYLYCTGYVNGTDRCVKRSLQIKPHQIEEIVLDAMREKFETLVIRKYESNQVNPEVVALQSELVSVSSQIEELINQIPKANEIVIKYINQKIVELDKRKSELESSIERLNRKQSTVDVDVISEPLQYWNDLTDVEKYSIARKMIDVINISDETGVEIVFSI